MTTNATAHAVNNAMGTALARFYEAHPEVEGIALDTVRDFAHERFVAACTPERVADPRFAAEAPDFAYLLLLRESLTLAQSLIR